MRRYKTNGAYIKQSRESRDVCSTQKELSHKAGISERYLRRIENENAEVPLEVCNRLAAALKVQLSQVIHPDDRITQVPSELASTSSKLPQKTEELKPTTWPRWDDIFLRATMDETHLFDEAYCCHEVISEVHISLTGDASRLVEELVTLLRKLSWSSRDILKEIDDIDKIKIRRRIRELLVLLKGNDIWVYESREFKWVPESNDVQPLEGRDMRLQTVLVFGAPGEYGEDTIQIRYDNGQPMERIEHQ